MKREINQVIEGNFIQRILIILGTIIAFALTGYLLLVLAYTIPTGNYADDSRMQTNVESAALELSSGGAYNSINGKKIDNFTDALMILTAVNSSSSNPFIAASENCRINIVGNLPMKR